MGSRERIILGIGAIVLSSSIGGGATQAGNNVTASVMLMLLLLSYAWVGHHLGKLEERQDGR